MILLETDLCLSIDHKALSTETYKFVQQSWKIQDPPWFLYEPTYIASDADHYIYIVDTLNNQIQKFTENGEFVTKWGSENNEYGQLKNPKGIAVNHYVYVADNENGRILKFNLNGLFIRWENDDIVNRYQADHCKPFAIAICNNGNLYISDMCQNDENTIKVFDTSGKLLNEFFVGNAWIYSLAIHHNSDHPNENEIYAVDYRDDTVMIINEKEISNPINIAAPTDITLDNKGNIYISSETDHCIYVYDQKFKKIAKWGKKGVGDGELNKPKGLLFNQYENYLYIVDSDNNRIQRLTKNGIFYDLWGPDNDPGALNNPKGLALDNQENVYVADKNNNRIQVFKKEGFFHLLWPNLNESFLPARIAINSSQQVYVTDEDNHKIFIFEKNGEKIDEWQNQDISFPNDIEIDSNNMIYIANTGKNNILKYNKKGKLQNIYSCNDSLIEPYGLAIGNDDTIVVADTGNNRLVRIHQDGKWEEIFEAYSFNKPYDIEIDDNNNIYIVDMQNHCIKKFSHNGEWIATIGSEGNLSGNFNKPVDCAITNQGEYVYVSDFGNHRIQKFKKIQTNSKDKAIIVAGGGRYNGNKLWNATQLCAYMAYRAFKNRGFKKESTLKFLSPVTKIDMDGNNLCDDITTTTLSQLEEAIKWSDGARNLILYLVDHGSHQQFLINEYDKLYASDLNEWLNKISVLNHIMIVYDACKAESFLSVLKKDGDQRIIISSSQYEAYFISQGVLSFSYYFWKNIINGNTFQDSFYQAQEAINSVTRGLQNARMEPQNFDFTIGDVNKPEKSLPVIEGISYSSNTLYVKIQNDEDIIVKGIILPPDFKQNRTDAAIIDFPSINLYGKDGVYQTAYNDPFHIGKNHYIIIQASNKFGKTSTDEIFLKEFDPVKRKAIIISNSSNNLGVTDKISFIYDTLCFQGYPNEDIAIFSHEPDLYLPQADPTEKNIKQAISECKSKFVKEMILCLIEIDERSLSYEKLNTWLNEIEQEMKGKIVIINNSNYLKNFLDNLYTENRVIVSTTTDKYPICQLIDFINPDINSFLIKKLCLDQNNLFCANTCDLFSVLFWNSIWSGLEINDAFINSKENMMMISDSYKDAFSIANKIFNKAGNEVNKMSNNIGLGIQLNSATFPASLNINITNKSNQLPISNAFISSNSLLSGCSSKNGRLHSIIEPSKNIEIIVLANGYERYYTEISIEEGEYKTISIALTTSESYINYSVACNKDTSQSSHYDPTEDVKKTSCFIGLISKHFFKRMD